MSNVRLSRFSLKRNNVKTFLFFLGFTSLLWLFIQFSKNYTREVEVIINYINLPQDKILNDASDKKLRLVLNGNGFRLITYSWTIPQLNLDISEADRSKNDVYYFDIDKEGQVLKNKLGFMGRVLHAQKDSLKAIFDVSLEKKVPIRLTEKIDYAPGYGSDRGMILRPDSIAIRGAQKVVDTIGFVVTEDINLENLNSDFKAILSVKMSQFLDVVEIYPKQVEATIAVSKFTEGSQEIPVTLINVPEGKEVKIFPKEVKVVYRVGLDKYNQINIRNFKVVADYNQVSGDSSFLILDLVDKPEFVHDVRLMDKQVQFVILNQEKG